MIDETITIIIILILITIIVLQSYVFKEILGYENLLTGLIYEEETFQEVNSFKFITYSRLEFCDERGKPQSQRSGGICRLTNKRLLFLSQFGEASKCNLV